MTSNVQTGAVAAEESVVDRTYHQVLELIIAFDIRPGERVNESELSRRLGISRTPLREALNRLVTEDFLTIQPSKGFFCRQVNAQQIFQLYQLRAAIEIAGVKLTVTRVEDDEIDSLEAFLDETRDSSGVRRQTLVGYDETFHETLLSLSGNAEMLNVLRSVNRKIRSIRWVDLANHRRDTTQQEHRAILAALRARDGDTIIGILEEHISRRLDQIDAAIREIYGDIYAGARSERISA